MSLTKRMILALALIAGITPAFAQVPPPVPALPDTERRTSYSISSSLCSCAIGFQLYADSTDVANWLEVFVNGVPIQQSGGWNITSPTGPIATIPRPITDAVLTFTAAQTGTVQIVGARRPRRTSQFQESQPVPTRNFNQTFSDIIATQRELWDKTNDFTGRGVFGRPGETLALLPILANRQNMGACFDSGGNLNSCVSVPSSTFAAGNGITLSGVGPTTITNNIAAGNGIAITGTNPLSIANNITAGPGVIISGTNPLTISSSTSTNTRSAYASVNSLQTTDCGKTVALGGSAFFTFTIPAASGFSATCQVLVVNEDSICPSGGATTCRGKTLAINGYQNFMLWPGQMFILVNQNNVWQYHQPGMWSMQNLETWYVCHTAGVKTYFAGGTSIGGTTPSDLNDGLSVNAPFATLQGAWAVLRSQIANNNFGPTLQQCNETFTELNFSAFGALTGTHALFLQGNPTTPSSVCLLLTGAGNAGLTARDFGIVIVSGFKLVGSAGASNIGMQASQGGIFDFRNMEFGAMPAGFHIQILAGGAINYSSGTYTVTGTDCSGALAGAPQFTNHIQTSGEGHGVINPPNVTVPNALTFSSWATVLGPNYLQLTGGAGVYTGTGAGAGSTGTKFQSQLNGVINLSGTILPGATAGTTATGGQVIP